ncbi:hypothetical protein DY000_02011751 [Brassica cretica]|uniref:Uncharacterized protein n=1 Tax=Brassica cretica TaxID=69181 RepID=A0ABQ7CVH7_BRACR|nr:hypothetical protein DY000_02011751 [Brassica cretica]
MNGSVGVTCLVPPVPVLHLPIDGQTGFDSGDHTFLYSLFGSLIHGYGFNLGFGGLEAGGDLE